MEPSIYPILEFDPSTEAIIEPGKVIESIDTPEYCVITFFQEVLDKLYDDGKSKILANHNWADKKRIEISKATEIIESMISKKHVLPPVDPNLIAHERGLFEYIFAKIKGED